MRFAASQKVKLEVSYQTPLTNDRYQTPFLGMGTLYYRLATGAAWAGAIGELNMEVRMPSDALVHIAPSGYVRAPGTVRWTLTDYDPAEDLAILLHPMYLGRHAAAVKARPPGPALARLAGEMRADVNELVRYAAFFQEVARRPLGLPDPRPDEVRACVEASAR